MIHIKKNSIGNGIGDFESWCGVSVSGLTRSYLSIDNAFMAIDSKVGTYPCHDCLNAIWEFSTNTLPLPTDKRGTSVGQKLSNSN